MEAIIIAVSIAGGLYATFGIREAWMGRKSVQKNAARTIR